MLNQVIAQQVARCCLPVFTIMVTLQPLPYHCHAKVVAHSSGSCYVASCRSSASVGALHCCRSAEHQVPSPNAVLGGEDVGVAGLGAQHQ